MILKSLLMPLPPHMEISGVLPPGIRVRAGSWLAVGLWDREQHFSLSAKPVAPDLP